MSIREFIIKLQDLSDKQKKIVLWTIVVVIAVIMGYFWIMGAVNSLSKIGDSVKSINFPTMDLPSTDLLQTTTPSDANPIADQTSDWKTYTNDEYGFQFDYPATLEINHSSSESTCEIANDKESPCKILPFYNIGVAVINHKFDEKIIWTRQLIQKYQSGDGDSKIITIGDKTAYEYDFVTGLSYKVHGIQIPLDGLHFLQIEENAKISVLTSQDWAKILSTFKFIK
jgi:hypothetical protein